MLQQWKLTDSGQLQLAGAVCLAVGNDSVTDVASGQPITGKPVGGDSGRNDAASTRAVAGRTSAGRAAVAVGYALAMTPCASAGSSAHWHKHRASSGVDSHGAVMIANDRRAGYCLTAQGGRVGAGAALIALPCMTSGDVDSQLFKF